MKRTIFCFFILLFGPPLLLRAQATLDTNGGLVTLADGSFVEYSVGEVATMTIGSPSEDVFITSGVIQPNYHFLVAVNEPFDEQYHLKVFPNPTDGRLTIETDFKGFTEFDFTDVLGRHIAKDKFDYAPMDISWLPAGTFFLTLSSEDNQIFKNIKIIKQ